MKTAACDPSEIEFSLNRSFSEVTQLSCFSVVQAESAQTGHSRVKTCSFVAQSQPWGLSIFVNSSKSQTVVVAVRFLVVAVEVVDFILEGIGIVFNWGQNNL